jgi:hypothetical protein
VRFILFGSLKNYSNLSGFPVAFISTYQTKFHHRLWRLPYTEVLVCHKQRVEVFHSNMSLERSWVPFRCWVSLFLTGFTSPSIYLEQSSKNRKSHNYSFKSNTNININMSPRFFRSLGLLEAAKNNN